MTRPVVARSTIRSLIRSPGFTVLAALLLTLALGLATTTFALVSATIHPRLPYRDPSKLYRVTIDEVGATQRDLTAAYELVRSERQVYSDFAAFTVGPARNIEVEGQPTNARERVVTANYFRLLGGDFYLGRGFRRENAADPEGAGVVVSYEFWARHLNRNEDLALAVITVDGQSMNVIGVLPPWSGEVFPPTFGSDEVFVVMPAIEADAPSRQTVTQVVLRLRPNQTAAATARELSRLNARLQAESAGSSRIWLRGQVPGNGGGSFSPFHKALSLAVIAIILIASANVVNIFTVRAIRRQREMAIRAALGASPRQLRRLVFIDAAVVSSIGSLGGLAVAGVTSGLVRHNLTTELVGLGFVVPAIDWRVLIFAAGSGAVVTQLISWVACRRAGIGDLSRWSGRGGGVAGRPGSRWQQVAASSQAALALVVLSLAALLVLAAGAIRRFPFGYDPLQVVAFRGVAPKTDTTTAQMEDFYSAVVGGLRNIQGVEAAAVAYTEGVKGAVVRSDGSGGASREMSVWSYRVVSSDFFRVLGVSPTYGIDFAPGNLTRDGAAIIDESVRRALWPGAFPIGRRILLGEPDSISAWVPVIGVIPDIRLRFTGDAAAAEGPTRGIYVMRLSRDAAKSRPRSILARVPSMRPEVAERASNYLGDVLPYQPRAEPIISEFRSELKVREFLATVFGVLGLFALLLSATGLYGIVSYSVGQRRREFAVRLALGARRTDIAKLVAIEGATVVLAGTAVGGLLVLWTGQALQHWLFTIRATDARALIVAEAILLVTSGVAVAGPAVQSARINPMELMRVE